MYLFSRVLCLVIDYLAVVYLTTLNVVYITEKLQSLRRQFALRHAFVPNIS